MKQEDKDVETSRRILDAGLTSTAISTLNDDYFSSKETSNRKWQRKPYFQGSFKSYHCRAAEQSGNLAWVYGGHAVYVCIVKDEPNALFAADPAFVDYDVIKTSSVGSLTQFFSPVAQPATPAVTVAEEADPLAVMAAAEAEVTQAYEAEISNHRRARRFVRE